MSEKTSSFTKCSCGNIVKGVCDVKAEYFIDKDSAVSRADKFRIVRNDASELYRCAVDNRNHFILGFFYGAAGKFINNKPSAAYSLEI